MVRREAGTHQYQSIWQNLERERAALHREARQLYLCVPRPESLPDPADQATAIRDHESLSRMMERTKYRLRQIESALDRMLMGWYGLCVGCGEEIPYKRLKVQPATLLCVPCQTRQEERARLRV